MDNQVSRSKLKRLAEAATPGPWEAYDTHGRRFVDGPNGKTVAVLKRSKQELADSLYIAAANPATILALLARVAELEALVRDTAAVLRKVTNTRYDPREVTAIERRIDAALAGQPQQGEPCDTCDGSGDVHRADGEWLGECPHCKTDRPAAVVDQVRDWMPMESAPKDGTLIRLLVEFSVHATEDQIEPSPTIGANSFDNTGEDIWKFAGWDWSNDRFTAGTGQPVGWLPLLAPAAVVMPAEPILVEAVATVVGDEENDLRLSWLLEGGISALEHPGTVLLIAHGTITDDEGSGYVYAAPVKP